MNKEQFEKELDMKLASLKEEMMQKFKEEQEDEFPEYKDDYWYITSVGAVALSWWSGNGTDAEKLAIGNVFRTKEEAEFETERLKVIAELKKYAEQKDKKWDGVNPHIYFYHDTKSNEISLATFFGCKTAALYFESEEKAKEAIEAVGEDRVKRFYLGVEE